MGRELAEKFPAARRVFDQADELLGIALSRLAWEGPEAELNDTLHTQPALLVHSVAALFVFNQLYPEFQPAFVAGHSMGELSALVSAGALTYLAALRLVHHRGELMKRAGEISPGGMAAIIGADLLTIEQVCKEASRDSEIVQVANDNCPGQVVISGTNSALERAIQIASQAGMRRIRRLAVSIASHSPLMSSAQVDFNQAVIAAPFTEPRTPLVGNVSALPLSTVDELRADLMAQLYSRVRWTESIKEMAARGINTFVEIGSGQVLSGLIKRIEPGAVCLNLGTPGDFEKVASA